MRKCAYDPRYPPSERVRTMPENTSEKKPAPANIAVGVRVLVRRQSEEAQTGHVIEDYAGSIHELSTELSTALHYSRVRFDTGPVTAPVRP
jgi:hypothetical protein